MSPPLLQLGTLKVVQRVINSDVTELIIPPISTKTSQSPPGGHLEYSTSVLLLGIVQWQEQKCFVIVKIEINHL